MCRLLATGFLMVGMAGESLAQCPGGVCLPEMSMSSSSSVVRARVSSRSGPGGGGLLGGLGRALLGRRAGGGGFASGTAYVAPGGSYGVPGTYAAPQLFAQAQTFAGGGSCYSSQAAAPMAYSPYAAPPAYSAPQGYSAPPVYSAPPPMYLWPQSSGVEDDWRPISLSSRPRVAAWVRPVGPSRRVRTGRPSSPSAVAERRPTAVAERPARTRPAEELAGRDR